MTASFTVACRLECYMVVPISGLSNAVSTFAGQNFGAGEYGRIRQGARHAVIMSLLLGLLICCGCYMGTERLIRIFGITDRAAELCTAHVRLICLDLLLYSAYQPFNGLFQGVGKGKIAMYMYMVEYCGRLFFANFLAGTMAEACVWWNEPPSYLMAGTLAYLYFFFGNWRKIPAKSKAVNA